MQGLMLKGDKTQLQNAPGELIEVCDEVKCIHKSLLGLLSGDEGEKHETWFKCCLMMSVLVQKSGLHAWLCLR